MRTCLRERAIVIILNAMKVAKLVAPGKMKLFEEPLPELRNVGEILIQPRFMGICGTDLHYFRHGGLGTHMQELPMSIGHEVSGTVMESLSEDFKTGDKLAIEPGLHCGNCKYCESGMQNLCENCRFIGSNVKGAFREWMVVDEKQVSGIPESMSLADAVMLEPLSVAIHAVRRSRLELGDSVAIYGVGPIGLLILQVCKAMGCGKSYVYDELDYRVSFAERFGAGPIDKEEPPTVDIAFDAAGAQETIDLCFRGAGKGGTVVLVGVPETDFIRYNPHIGRVKELNVYNCRRANRALSLALELFLSDKVSFEGMVTHTFSLERIQEAFETAANYRDQVIKAVIQMG